MSVEVYCINFNREDYDRSKRRSGVVDKLLLWPGHATSWH